MNERELLVDCLRRLNRTGVVAVQAGALDKNYLKQWAQELKLTGELEPLLSGEIKPKQT